MSSFLEIALAAMSTTVELTGFSPTPNSFGTGGNDNDIISGGSGSNLVLTTSAGNITVKGAKNSEITVIDKNESETTQLYGRINYSADKTAVTLTSTFTGMLNADNYPSTVKEIDAASTSKATITSSPMLLS